MPYKNNNDLHDSVKNHLLSYAKGIYRAAFNHVFEPYKDVDKRRGNDSRETVAHKVAWSACRKKIP
ncbi:cation transport regulator [Candidatus Rickettsia kotlanii]|nr:cation transport regulator [Candidatus Rickettsia kotlanii]BDU61477.1 cation transport regulator [Candidatus Rickettsia kotlanii]